MGKLKKIDNKGRAMVTAGMLTLSILVLTGVALLLLTFKSVDSFIIGGLFLAAVLLLFYFIAGGFCYVELEKKKEALEVRYYKLFPIGRKYKMIRIPFVFFKEVKIVKSPLANWLSLSQTKGRGGEVIKYPLVGLSAFGKKEMQMLKEFLKGMK